MRDKKRIRPYLKQFRELWEENPDLRFGQIVDIVRAKHGFDLFNVEDDRFFACLNVLNGVGPRRSEANG